MAREQYARHVELSVWRGTTTKPPLVLPGARKSIRDTAFFLFFML
jgi:hypothetical protein